MNKLQWFMVVLLVVMVAGCSFLPKELKTKIKVIPDRIAKAKVKMASLSSW